MASDIGALFNFIMRLFTYEVTIYGVTFSMFCVFSSNRGKVISNSGRLSAS